MSDVIGVIRDATAHRSAILRYQMNRDRHLKEMARLHAEGHHQKAYEAAAWAGWCSRALQAEQLDPEPRAHSEVVATRDCSHCGARQGEYHGTNCDAPMSHE